MQNRIKNRQNLYQSVSEYLIDSFMKKKYKPGDRLIESKVARELNVNQGAVREAIRILVEKGFLTYEPYKGTRFKKYSIEDLEDFLKVRVELEKIAIKWAIEKNGWESFNITYLENRIKKMIGYVKGKKYIMRINEDKKFHKHLVNASGSKCLLETWIKLSDYYWSHVWLFYDRFLNKTFLQEKSIRHKPIIEAIRSRDRDLLITSLESHFIDLRKFIRSNIKEKL